MVKNALGLIEIVGLAAAMEAADAALKAANVELIGYELAKGGGLVVIKISGDVGAVKAGVQAGMIAGGKVNKVWATHVIPRPHQSLTCILESKETVGLKAPIKPTRNEVIVEVPLEVVEAEAALEDLNEVNEAADVQSELQEELVEDAEAEVSTEEIETETVEDKADKQEKNVADYCNLCGDPACSRVKGDPKVTCIHYDKNNKEAE